MISYGHASVTIGRATFGFHRRGNCWSLFRLPSKQRYGNGTTWFSWWRLFIIWSHT